MRKWSFLGPVLISTAPYFAVAAPRTFSELADLVTNLINGGIGVAFILGIVVYFFGIVTSISKLREGDNERIKAYFVWGIIALFVMFSVWGILALVRNTLFGGGAGGSVNDFNSSNQVLCTSPTDCTIPE